MEFEIEFYKDEKGRNPIQEFMLELDKTNRVLVAKAREGIGKLKHKVYHREPLSKHVEPGLWELRIRAKADILRILYTFRKDKIIILLHAFVKKKQKTPVGELETARKRLEEIKLQGVN